MGFLSKSTPSAAVQRLPTGTFTIDSEGRVVSSTVPGSVPPAILREIGQSVVEVFSGARKVNVSFSEMVASYNTFKITAREMRGGAIIFLSPKTPQMVTSS